MSRHAVKFDYPHDQIYLILRDSYKEDIYFGVDKFESKRLKIILAKYGCRHSFHTLPGHLTAEMHPFRWNNINRCFKIEMGEKSSVHLNTLEESIIHHQMFEVG